MQEKCLLSITEASKLFGIGQHRKFRKTESLVKQYDMTTFNDLARENTKCRKNNKVYYERSV